MQLGRTLLFIGLVLVAAGLVFMLGEKFGLGRLPGDIVIRRKNFTLFLPIASSILVSLVLSLLFSLFRK